MTSYFDQRTAELGIPLPHPDNELRIDVLRMREAIATISAILAAKADTTYVDSNFAGLIDAAPAALNTLKEFAEAIGNDPNYSVTVVRRLDENEKGARRARSIGVMGL